MTVDKAVAPDSTASYSEVMAPSDEISQRDLRLRSKEIMDALESGRSFVVTRSGHQIGELVPLRSRRRFVSCEDFVRTSGSAPVVDLERFRADQRAAADQSRRDPYAD